MRMRSARAAGVAGRSNGCPAAHRILADSAVPAALHSARRDHTDGVFDYGRIFARFECVTGRAREYAPGWMSVRMEDGTVIELTPGTVFHIPPGHDAWTEGDEACVELDFGGLTGYAVPKK